MPYVYSNNGKSSRWVDPSEKYQLKVGEVLLDSAKLGRDITPADIAAAFPNFDPLGDLKNNKIAELRAACNATMISGYASSALGTPHTYPSTQLDQQNMIASVTASLLPTPPGWSTPFWCVDANGVWALTLHTVQQIQQAGLDGKAFIVSCQQKLLSLSTQTLMANTADAVAAIVW